MKIVIALVLLLMATGPVYSQERHGGGGGDRGGGHGFGGHPGGFGGDHHFNGGDWPHGGGAWGHNSDNGFLGGIVGGLFGELLRQPPPPPPPVEEAPLVPWTAEWYDWCGNKYRTFDPKTGYYNGFDGAKHFCTGS